MIVKKHNHDGRLVLAICDEELLNKKISEGDLCLDLSASFFKGEKVEESLVLALIKKAYIVNAVGNKSILLLKKEGFIDEDDVLFVSKTPYSQVIFDSRR